MEWATVVGPRSVRGGGDLAVGHCRPGARLDVRLSRGRVGDRGGGGGALGRRSSLRGGGEVLRGGGLWGRGFGFDSRDGARWGPTLLGRGGRLGRRGWGAGSR